MRVRIAFPIIVAVLTIAAFYAWRDSNEFLPTDFEVPFGHVYRNTQCILFSTTPNFEANFGGTLLMLHPQTIIFKHGGTYVILNKTFFFIVVLAFLFVALGFCAKTKSGTHSLKRPAFTRAE